MSGIVARLMRPTKAVGGLGETQGTPEVVCPAVPFRRFKTLSGDEQESARQNGVTAQYAIEIYGIPTWKDLEECWFEILPLTDPPRRFNIAFVEDKRLNGIELRLLCGENK